MSHTAIMEGLVERFEDGVTGLAQYDDNNVLVNILDYEPTALHTTPTLYMILDSATRVTHGNVTAMRERIRARLCIKWQDNEFAEEELMAFINSIPAAIDADPQLGNRINSGLAMVDELLGEYVSIGGVLYRVMNYFINVLDKGAYGSGI